jgi:transcriptional regulator with XRE-family HTH domain
VDDVRQGRICRALRRRATLTQRELGARCGLSQQAISLVERGHGSRLSVAALRRLFAALDARWEPFISWRGGELDRLLDEQHAVLVAATVLLLQARRWACQIEVSYAWFGERGSIDVLGWDPRTRTALVVEVKSELASVERTLRKLDEKVRLAAERIAAERFGAPPAAVARLVVLPATTTERRRVARHEGVLSAALPTRGDAVRGWLRSPNGALRGLLFVAPTNPGGARRR